MLHPASERGKVLTFFNRKEQESKYLSLDFCKYFAFVLMFRCMESVAGEMLGVLDLFLRGASSTFFGAIDKFF